MKRTYIILSLAVCMLVGVGCAPEEQQTPPAVSNEATDEQTIEMVEVPPVPDVLDMIPVDAQEVDARALDLDGDGVDEYAIQYTDPDVLVRANDAQPIQYLHVFQLQDNEWVEIKKDQAAVGSTTIGQMFCFFAITNFGDDKTEELLTAKCQFPRALKKGYALFGLQPDGTMGDFPIPKGYLNEEKYIEKDEALFFLGVKPEDNAFRETYEVECPEKDYYGGRMYGNDAHNGPCEKFDLVIPFLPETGTFGLPKREEQPIL